MRGSLRLQTRFALTSPSTSQGPTRPRGVLEAQPELVKTLDAAEKKRRERKASKAGDDAQANLALGGGDDDEPVDEESDD